MRIHFATVLCLLSLVGAEAVHGQPEHITWSVASCLTCHAPEESAELAARVTRPCSTLCSKCHGFRETHHPVGVTIPAAVPATLQLTQKGTNACVTCHDVTRPRFEGSPWTSTSLFARALSRTKENRTYYLVMRNDRGQLCRNCH